MITNKSVENLFVEEENYLTYAYCEYDDNIDFDFFILKNLDDELLYEEQGSSLDISLYNFFSGIGKRLSIEEINNMEYKIG